MGIPNVSEITTKMVPATPAFLVASRTAAAPTSEKQAAPTAPVVEASAPPPVLGFPQDVEVGKDEATGRRVYDFVDPDSGETVVQIPAQAVLDLVGEILRKLEAEGLR